MKDTKHNSTIRKPSLVQFILIIFFLIQTIAEANNYRFNHITSKDGLAQNTVTFVLQDYKGFLWFGSYGGLNRYDGNRIKRFRNDVNDSTTLTSNAIKWIHEDSNKNLWIGCYNGGLHKYDRDKEEFIHFPNTLDTNKIGNYDNILNIVEDSSGILWIGNEGGLSAFNPVTGKYLRHYYNFVDDPNNPNAREVFSTFIDSENNLWLGLRKKFGILDKRTGRFTPHIYNTEFSTNYIIQDKEKNFWLSSINNGVIEYKIGKGIIKHYKSTNSDGMALCGNNTFILYADDYDNIWVGTQGNGISIISKRTNSISHLYHDVSNPLSISNNNIFSFYKDRSGVFWIGTDLGANSLVLDSKQFQSLTLYQSPENKLNDVLISSILKDKKGNFWFGTWGTGIYYYNPAEKKYTQLKNMPGNSNSLSNNTIRFMHLDSKDRLWVATNGGGLNIYDVNTKKFLIFSEDLPKSYIPDNVFNHIYEDRDGNIWLGSWHGGLLKTNLDSDNNFSYTQYLPEKGNHESLNHKTVSRIFQDSKGAYWIATKGAGINKIIGYDSKGKPRFKHYSNIRGDENSLSSNEVMVIYEDENNNIWIGTNAGGFSKLNSDDETFTNYTVRDGLISNVISGITGDGNGNLWISTLEGLSKFNINSRSFNNYDFEDGLISYSFLENSFYKDESGIIYFGGDNGITYFHPDSIRSGFIVPQVAITNLFIFNRPVTIGQKINDNIVLKKSILESDEITLTHKESVISFEFAALHFAAPNKNKFVYRLLGFDEAWQSVRPGRQFATYTNLDPGEYTFQVKASNNDGVWNEMPASIKIIISPPFYATTYAYLFYAAAGMLIVFGIIKIKTRSQEKELAILRKADSIKSEFLAQMSHEIRSPINIILSYSNLIQEELNEKITDDMKDYFVSINNAGKRIIRTIDMLLNMSEMRTGTYEYTPKKVDLKNDILLVAINEYERLANEKGLKLELVEEYELPELILDEYTVTQIFSNLIDNAIKYTTNGFIRVIISKGLKNKTVITVEDSGIGIAEEFLPYIFDAFSQEEHGYTRKFEGNGLGLALVKKYCELNKADISVKSTKGVGTKFFITFNLPAEV